MVESLYRKSAPARKACAPAWWERLSATSYRRFWRRVGDPDSVPKLATPEILTAGPIGSDGGACKSLNTIWPRVSLTVRELNVATLPIAIVWSRLSNPADALAALSAPAPREFGLFTSYRL